MTRITKALLASAASLTLVGIVQAAPYASAVSLSGSNVNFVLNEPADVLAYQINGGAYQLLDGSTKGSKSFSLGSPTDTFSITVRKSDAIGFTIPTGGTQAATTNGLSQPTALSGTRLISEDTNVLNRFNSPRGVSVNNNPAAGALFGTSYIGNSASGTIAASGSIPTRTLGDGLYAVRADQSDAFGYGNTAKAGGISIWTSGASASSPFRVTVGDDSNIYIADFADSSGNVWRMDSALNTGTQLLAGTGGPTALPVGQNHGSTTAVYPLITANGLTLYTLDEDLTTTQTGAGVGTDKNHLWRYDIGTAALPYGSMPVKVNQSSVLVTASTSDLDYGKVDGKFYLAQNRSTGADPGIVVLNPDGTTAFDSLSATRTLLANPTAIDIFRNVLAMDVSDDQKWMAVLLNGSDVSLIPLVGGIPDIANRLVVDSSSPDVNSGRDIAFDAAGNLHYVSSGQGLYRVLSPGGVTQFVTTYDGQRLSFAVPEPTSIAALGLLSTMIIRRRK